jgi:hypothetical protein
MPSTCGAIGMTVSFAWTLGLVHVYCSLSAHPVFLLRVHGRAVRCALSAPRRSVAQMQTALWPARIGR